MSAVIDYAVPTRSPRWARLRRQKKLWSMAAVLLLLLVCLPIGDRRDMGWICATCGSDRTQTDWDLGFTTARAVRTSALDRWLTQNNHPHVHDWRNIKGTYVDIFGRHIGSGHGSAPPIYTLRPVLDDYMKLATRAELLELHRILTEGSDTQQQRVIEQVADKVFGPRPPP